MRSFNRNSKSNRNVRRRSSSRDFTVLRCKAAEEQEEKIMLVFNTVEDVLCADINSAIKAYLSNYIKQILNAYGENTLENVGSLFFVSDDAESTPMFIHTIWEYAELIHIHDPVNQSTTSVIHGVAVKNNDCAFDVFIPLSAPESKTKRKMLEIADETLYINL